MKETLEYIGLKKEEVTTPSVYAINIYPSIKLAGIKKAVRYFVRTLTRETKKGKYLSHILSGCHFFFL